MAAGCVDEQPADVRVGQTLQSTAQAAAVIHVRAMRIAVAIGESVVLAMVGYPRDDGTLDRGRAEHGENEAKERGCLERAMGKETVKADRHPERRGDVHDREHDQVRAVKQAIPQLPADEAKCENRTDGDQTRQEAVQVLEDGGLNVVRGRAIKRGTVEAMTRDRGIIRTLPGGRGALDRIGAHRCTRDGTLARPDDARDTAHFVRYLVDTMLNTGWRANAIR